MRPVKQRGAEFWDAVTDTGGDRQGDGATEFTDSTAVEKVWLDGRRKASLDKSVPQIGAPTAWAAGFDGTGIKVAVLDTGIDTAHADLAGQVIEERDFSGSSGTGDKFGHGTHVASITAGTGARSGGKYKGVAPGAKLLNGKVLDDNGFGSDSGIIAGMEWAVAQGANVVNLSLGGTDMPGIDPMEETVNRLSAESDTLFVIAAGNEGEFGEGTVGSPGSADAALTVGAVDKADQLADFSSRGPRVGDGGVKPDLTAPGVAITAAAAAGSVLEEQYPSDIPGYLTIDGTSMATPHVAGAAAILAQQHPDWTGERLKAVLTGSAKPGAYSSFQQGTGRTDVVRAMEQSVVTEQGPIDFGKQQWPHTDDTPATKKLTYRNLGTEPVTLDLSVDAFAVDGKPAAEGMFAVSPRQLTVPAGGEASADVTADTRARQRRRLLRRLGAGRLGRRQGPGAYRRRRGARGRVVRPDAEAPRRERRADRRRRHRRQRLRQRLLRQLRRRAGRRAHGRAAQGRLHPQRGDPPLVRRPPRTPCWCSRSCSLDRDTTVTVDARQARPVDITVPDAAAENTEAMVAYSYDRGEGQRPGNLQYMPADLRGHAVRAARTRAVRGRGVRRCSPATGPARTTTGRPVTYHLGWNRAGRLGGFAANGRAEAARQGRPPGGRARRRAEASRSRSSPTRPTGTWSSATTTCAGPAAAHHRLRPRQRRQVVLPHVADQRRGPRDGLGELPDADAEDLAGRTELHRAVQRRRLRPGPARRRVTPDRSSGFPGVARYGNVIRAYHAAVRRRRRALGHRRRDLGGRAPSQADGKEIADDYGTRRPTASPSTPSRPRTARTS